LEAANVSEVYRAVWVVAYRDLLRFFSDRARLMSSVAMPLLFLVVFGAGFNNVIGSLTPGVDFIKFIYPGIIAMTVVNNSLFSGLSIVWDREFGFLKELLVAPLSRTGIILGKAVGSAVVALMQGSIMLLLAPIVGVSLSVPLVLKLVPCLVALSLSVSGLGVLIAARMRSQQGFQMVMQLLVMPLIFTGGVMFPVNRAPTWLSLISKVNPVTYGADSVRRLFLERLASGTAGPSASLGVTVFGHTMGVLEDVLLVLVIGVFFMTAAIWAFNRQD
jgi:ABC-2 type transport system permease protein